jgi:hypothetical protein
MREVESWCFRGCTGLKSITLPDPVYKIGQLAFQGCSSLVSVTLGSKIQNLGYGAFSDCQDLADFYCYTTTVPGKEVYGASFFEGSYINYATLHVPDFVLDDYRTTSPWSEFGKFEGITGVSIRGIKADMGAEDSPYYSLDGMRVAQPGKGLYIKDGRKVVVK